MRPVIVLLCIAVAFVARAETEPPAKVLARVALLSDPHVNGATNGNEAAFKVRFQKAIAQVNDAKVDVVLIAGDLTQSGLPQEFTDFKNHIKALHAPVYFVPGNHDVGHKFNSGKTNGTVIPGRVEDYERALGPSWFVKRKAGLRIIGINSSLLGSSFFQEEQMWAFLERELAQPARRPTILFMHYPLFLRTLDEPGGDYFNTELEPRMHLYNLLKQAGVKIVLTGHLHRSLINRRDGILLLTTPPVSFGLPAGKQAEGWTLVTVFTNGDAKEEFQIIQQPQAVPKGANR